MGPREEAWRSSSLFFFQEGGAREGGAAAARFAERLCGEEGRAKAETRRPLPMPPTRGREAAARRIARFD